MGILFREGAQVWNKDHGVGTVADCSEEEVLVEFDSGKDELYEIKPRKLPPLIKLQPDGFWLRKKNNTSNFASIVEENPLEAILALAKDEFTSITLKQLKSAVSPELVPGDKWEEWKKNAIEMLGDDPRFEVDKDKITFQGDMMEIAEDLMRDFRKAPSLKEKQKIARKVLKAAEKGVPVEDVQEAAISFFTGTAANEDNTMGARLEALFFLKELDPETFDYMMGPFNEEIAEMDLESAAEAVAIISDAAIRKSLMDIIKAQKSESFIAIAIQITKRFKKTQRDWVLDYLIEHEDKKPIKTIVEKTMSDIATNLQPFVWLCKTTISKPEKLQITGQSPETMVPAMFRMFSNMYVTSAFSVRPKDDRSVSREEDEILKLMVNHKLILSFLKKQPDSLVRTFASRYRDCNAIPNEIREDFIDKKFAKEFPGIELLEAENTEEEVTILTRETYEKYTAELLEIVEHGFDDATRAISTAREFGDISENAELEIAQENQRKLMLRKNQLQNILKDCKVLD